MAKIPNFLKKGDEIRIVSPSGSISEAYIDGTKNLLTAWGYKVTEGMFTRTQYGRFAGTTQERYTDIQQAMDDENVRAIFCSRGGYGLAEYIDRLDYTHFQKSPKWVIGFSDITLLHQSLVKNGFVAIHGAMAKTLALSNGTASHSQTILQKILNGRFPEYQIDPNTHNQMGEGKGKLIGGNLSVFMGMRGTALDYDYRNTILFIEDIGEPPYKIDRMLQNLRISGVLQSLKGIIVGRFTEYEEDETIHKSLYDIISDAVKEYDYPVCFDFSAGHIDENFPLLLGQTCTLKVAENGATLKFNSPFWKKAGQFIKGTSIN